MIFFQGFAGGYRGYDETGAYEYHLLDIALPEEGVQVPVIGYPYLQHYLRVVVRQRVFTCHHWASRGYWLGPPWIPYFNEPEPPPPVPECSMCAPPKPQMPQLPSGVTFSFERKDGS